MLVNNIPSVVRIGVTLGVIDNCSFKITKSYQYVIGLVQSLVQRSNSFYRPSSISRTLAFSLSARAAARFLFPMLQMPCSLASFCFVADNLNAGVWGNVGNHRLTMLIKYGWSRLIQHRYAFLKLPIEQLQLSCLRGAGRVFFRCRNRNICPTPGNANPTFRIEKPDFLQKKNNLVGLFS